MMPKTFWLLVVIAVCSILGALAQLLWKTGVTPFNWKRLILGLFLYGIATIAYIAMLRYVPLSIGYPIIALSYLWVMILSIIVLHEKVTILNVLGSFVIVIGVGLTQVR